jgi:hypothetical protein
MDTTRPLSVTASNQSPAKSFKTICKLNSAPIANNGDCLILPRAQTTLDRIAASRSYRRRRQRARRNCVGAARDWTGETVHGIRLEAPEHWKNLRLIYKDSQSGGLLRRSTAITPTGPAIKFDHRHTGCPLTFSSAHSLRTWAGSVLFARDLLRCGIGK